MGEGKGRRKPDRSGVWEKWAQPNKTLDYGRGFGF